MSFLFREKSPQAGQASGAVFGDWVTESGLCRQSRAEKGSGDSEDDLLQPFSGYQGEERRMFKPKENKDSFTQQERIGPGGKEKGI